MKRKLSYVALVVFLLSGISLIPVGGVDPEADGIAIKEVSTVDMEKFGTNKPERPLNLFFIHHSCGGQLFAPQGSDSGEDCIYQSHPNGGGLRGLLEAEGYSVHEASYASELGDKTDIFDWLPKFRDKMDKIVTASGPDSYFEDGTKNDIVAFKSCFPNSRFVGVGEEPGDPKGPQLTVANAKATYSALLAEFQKKPDVLFVALTAPPLIGERPAEPLWKRVARLALGKQHPDDSKTGPLARQFNNWLKAEDGWLKGYPLKNVVVFDYYDILTDDGKSNFLRFAATPNDEHPNKEGNTVAAKRFVPFINGAVRRAGIEGAATNDSAE
jgi:hypothetical protein